MAFAIIIPNIGFYLMMATFAAIMKKMVSYEDVSILVGMITILSFVIYSLFLVVIQKVIVDEIKELYPEKKGNAYNINFQKEWEKSLDEREKVALYYSGYKTYKAIDKVLIALLVLTAMLSDVQGVNLGIYPPLVISLILVLSNIVYLYYWIKSDNLVKKKEKIMKRFGKMGLTLALALMMIFTSIPALGAEVVDTNISPWALLTVNDGQMMGLVTMSAESLDKDYTKEITAEEIKDLNEGIIAKLETQNLKKNEAFKGVEVEFDSTREAILLNLFNILGKFDKTVTEETDLIEYMVKNNILKGKGNDYGLKDIATLEEGIVFYTRAITDVYDDHDLGGKGVFYKVEHKGNTVYLFGSVHIGDISMYPIEAERMNAFNKSDELYVEINLLDPELIAETQKYQIKTDGTTLKDEVGEETYVRIKKLMDTIGLPEEMYANMEGWALFNTLSMLPIQMTDPYTTAFGVDVYFLTNAMLEEKPIKSIETVELQMNTLKDYFTENKSGLLENIKEILTAFEKEELDEIVKEYRDLMVAWRDGDINKFITMYDENEESKILLENRDPEMAKTIKGLLEADGEKTYFVLVGAGHYAPENSVLKYLKDYGFTVQDLNK